MRKLLSQIVWAWTALACMTMAVRAMDAYPAVPWYTSIPCFLLCFWGAVICCLKAYPDGLFGIRP
jgi:hypothetical protein